MIMDKKLPTRFNSVCLGLPTDCMCSIFHNVATSWLALHWMCNSPQTGCARRITPHVCGVNKQNQSDLVRWSLLLLAVTVWRFAHLAFGLSDHNNNPE